MYKDFLDRIPATWGISDVFPLHPYFRPFASLIAVMRTLILVCLCYDLVEGGHPVKPQPPNKPPSSYKEKLVEYGAENGTVLEGFLVYPKGLIKCLLKTEFIRSYDKRPKAAPAVIVFHAFTGRTEFDNQKARDLAKLGYVAFAADVYGKGVASNDTNENFALMGQMLAERTTTLQKRVREAWKLVKNLPFVNNQKIGCIGFCFGGLTCLDLARAIGASIQAHHGDADPHTTNENAADFLEEMRERQADWHFTSYGGAEHAFTLPGVENLGIPGAAYNEKADKRSWRAMQGFLAEKLL
ncbi:carboxymethylenebutenolidase [Ancylostoma duodenale]|uniref:Carboxymethylenebutenolidase n=1 Tax=Ancylostoma duodenale TaxID=51022 RepID=A0A0C2GJB5_9BILA|nr:carboxymethylenebutenolidase [Ancylostoma duodenale]